MGGDVPNKELPVTLDPEFCLSLLTMGIGRDVTKTSEEDFIIGVAVDNNLGMQSLLTSCGPNPLPSF